MGMGRATAGVQNASNGVQSGMGGKGKGGGQPVQLGQSNQPQFTFSGKGGAQQQYQQPMQQSPYQQPIQQNPYAQQYYQPQFQPQSFSNPYAQGQFGQQMGGFGGKGGQIQQFLQQQPQPQGGFNGKGGQMGGYQEGMYQRPRGFRGAAQSGLAALTPAQALAQPTATTQALESTTAAPEQPYMGNYLK